LRELFISLAAFVVRIRSLLIPPGRDDPKRDSPDIQVLRPLCWTGLLHQQRGADSFRTDDVVFAKTPLWKSSLRLETDRMVASPTRH
jgi:hypothetical protein